MTGVERVAEAYTRLQEEHRTRRRTVADALDVFRQQFGLEEIGRCQIKVGEFEIAFRPTAVIAVAFSDFGCAVSLPTSARFRARRAANLDKEEFDITLLDDAEVQADASVVLADGNQLRSVEVIPTHLPYHPSVLDRQILGHVIAQTEAWYCFRNIRKDLPEKQRDGIPDLWVLDFDRVRTIEAPALKVIRGYIQDKDPRLKVSNQKIADILAVFGIRAPRRRRPYELPQSELDRAC
jgi:hypothetical protein